ncbi:hypothetical protein MMC34_000403 [Xylographa carneopallida]|nr:hypothetical protein [Xylographa carneopallida]
MVYRRTEPLTAIERMKLDVQDGASFGAAQLAIERRWDHSGRYVDAAKTWKYYDDELPKWYKVWQDKQEELESDL